MARKIVVLFLLNLVAAIASPLTWVLNTTFDDGGAASGFFVFDANTNTVSNWNIAATAGSALAAFDYTTSNSTASGSSGNVTFGSNQTFPNNLPPPLNFNEKRLLILDFIGSLTNAGGSVGLLSGPNASRECLNCDPFRLPVTGTVTSSVPEPGSLGLFLVGGGIFVGFLRRKTLP